MNTENKKVEQYNLDEFFALNKKIQEYKKIGSDPESITIYYCADEDAYYTKGHFSYSRYDVESIIKLPISSKKELNDWIENVSNTLSNSNA